MDKNFSARQPSRILDSTMQRDGGGEEEDHCVERSERRMAYFLLQQTTARLILVWEDSMYNTFVYQIQLRNCGESHDTLYLPIYHGSTNIDPGNRDLSVSVGIDRRRGPQDKDKEGEREEERAESSWLGRRKRHNCKSWPRPHINHDYSAFLPGGYQILS